jgi:hypothetical protein
LLLEAPVFCPAGVRWCAPRALAGVWLRAAAAELDTIARDDWADDVDAGEAATVGAGGGGSAECSAAESGAGAGSDGCDAAAVGGTEAGADARTGSSAARGAGACAKGGVVASGPDASVGGGAVKGFGGGARRGGTIRNPATVTAATAPKIITRDFVLLGGSGALNLGACALAPCLTARSAATCAA